MALSTKALEPSFQRPASRVAIRRATSYEADLQALLDETLREFHLPVKGKSVLLKPNFVGPDPLGIVNTHPAVVAAARESFLRLGAASVVIGEGPALERDTEAIVETLRLRDHLGPLRGSFVDLNVDEVRPVTLRTKASALGQLYLPRTVLESDFVVSVAKMKTHHWAGVTLSLKNMFGIVPGSCYGWPKNILHWAGITRAVLDINSTVLPDFAIVDGVVGMEGDGPTQGKPNACGVLICGDDPVAVDATCARVMGLAPEKIEYLSRAAVLLGHLKEEKIVQIGEKTEQARRRFEVINVFKHLRVQ
jgi:uncharacterized protein (DUF362 family)